MDYRLEKEKRSTAKREKIIFAAMLAMVCVIIAQTVIAVILWASVGRTKAMYEEALQDRAEMQEEINALTGYKPDVSENYGVQEEETDIPFVTKGGEELDESGGDNQ